VAFAGGRVPQDVPRHVRLADLLFVLRLQVGPCLVQDRAQELDGLRILSAWSTCGAPSLVRFDNERYHQRLSGA
jgi:hypothetical protein